MNQTAMQMDRLPSLTQISQPRVMMRQQAAFVMAICIVSQSSLAPAQSAVPEGKINASEAGSLQVDDATLVDQLSKGRYSSRQRATLKMWGARDELREQVQSAARDSNPEVAGRAKWILDQWRRGTTPDMPPRLMRLLQRGDDPSAIVELVELGRFEDAVVAVEESKSTIEFEQIQTRLTSAFATRFPFYVELALQEDAFDALLRLIDMSATNKEMAVCRVRLLQHFGKEIDEDNMLPSSSKQWTPRERDAAKVAVLAVLGDYDAAVAKAKTSTDDNLIRASLMLAGQWEELVDRSVAKAESANEKIGKPLMQATVSHWVNALVAADRCGDKTSAAKAVAALAAVRPSHDGFDLAWKALSLHGEMDAVFELLGDESPEILTDVALAASRPEIVFERLNFPIDQLDLELQSWIDDAISKQLVEMPLIDTPPRGVQGRNQRASYPDSPNLPVRRMMALMKCLIVVGRFDAAWEIASQFSDESIHFGQSPNTTTLRDVVLQNLASSERKDWVMRLAVLEGGTSLSLSAQRAISRVLLDVEPETFNELVDALGKSFRLVPFEQRVQMAYELCEGKTPSRFYGGLNRQNAFEELYKVLSEGSTNSLFRRRSLSNRRNQVSRDWAKFFARHGQSTLATRCLTDLIRRGDLDSLYDVAVHEVSSGNIDRAEQYFEAIWIRVKNDGRLLASGGFQDDSMVVAAKALIGRWMNAKRIGDEVLTEQLGKTIELSLCSPSTEFLDAIAEVLAEHGGDEMAKGVYEVLLPLTALGSPEAIEFYDVARKYSILIRESDAESAIRWFDLAVGGTLESTYFRSSAYISLPLYIRRWALEAAIDAKDQSAAREHLVRLTKLDPLDITSAEELLPQLRKAGMDDLANEVFDQLFERGLEHCRQFPFNVTMGNNVAWAAAMNDRRLEEALVLSERTVYFEPESAIYRDTLAEILFRLGRKEQALHVEQACLLDDPTEWHLHQQVEKYREAVAGRH